MNKTYIITGASSDIGIEFLKRLNGTVTEKISAHCQYFLNNSELLKLQEQCEKIEITAYRCDLSDEKGTEAWVAEMKNSGIIPTHILHLAASKLEYMKLKQFDWEKTTMELNVSVNSLAQIFKAFLPVMSKQKYGKIAAMLSVCVNGVPPKFMSDYIIVKYALLGLIKSAASEYAGTGITINGLSPNMIETKFLSNIDKRIIEITAHESKMKRNVKIGEVVDALNFLLSDSTDYITGVNLNMSGGDRM